MSDSHKSIEVIGADISQCEIVIAWARSQRPCQRIANKREAIVVWLKQLPAGCVIGMEATGRLHQQLADLAAGHGHVVYVLNPKYVASCAMGVGRRGKTEGTRSNRALKSLNTLLAELNNELKRVIAHNDELENKRKQLQRIRGIGFINSAALTHRFDHTPFANSDAVVAAYGLDPRPKDSGTHQGKRRLTKQGNAEDRRLIYLAGQAAAKTKLFKPIYRALLARGLATTEAIVILARKLLRIAFAIWTSGQPFKPDMVGKKPC